jgi:hypothetical protein
MLSQDLGKIRSLRLGRRSPQPKLTTDQPNLIAQRGKCPRIVSAQLLARRHLLVDDFKPQHVPCQTPDQKPLRGRRRAANLRRQLPLNLRQKPAFTRAAIDPVAKHATTKNAALDRHRPHFPDRINSVHAVKLP